MRNSKIFKLILTCLITLILSSITFAAKVDILPPKGEIVIENASLKDDVYYTTVSNVTLNITATDNVTLEDNLKMTLSKTPLTGDELARESIWVDFKSTYPWTIEGEVGEVNTIYLYLKDEGGNISPNIVTSTKQFTVTYEAEGATNIPTAQVATYGQPFNVAVKEPKKANKFFMGWSLDPAATAESWLSDDTIEAKYITSNITLYAVWGDEPRNFSEVAKVGDYVAYPVEYENVSINSSKSNEIGWRVLEVSNGVVKLISAGTPLSYNKTSSNTDAINKLTTNFINGTSATYAGYGFTKDIKTTFSNQYTSNVASVTAGDITKLTNQTTLTDLSISNYGGILNNRTNYYIASPADTEKLYYVEANNRKISSATGATYGIRPVVTLYDAVNVIGRNQAGEWQLDMPSVKVNFNTNGGTSAEEYKTYKYQNTYDSLPTPTKIGYTFCGWYTAEENGDLVTEETKVSNLSEHTLYAHWDASKYAVTFDSNGGTLTAGGTTTTKEVTFGSAYGTLPEATKEGYTLLGWYTSKEDGTEITAETIVDTSANGLTLYAHWKESVLMDLILSIANAPLLGEGMKAVYWTDDNGNGETTSDTYPAGTYNYTIGDGKTDTKENKWANAVTTSDGSYWVWIPRYAYKITYTTDSAKTALSETKTKYGNIDILYMYGTSETHYRDINGNAVELPEGYKLHPAFQRMTTEADLATNPLGKWDEELEGIWVAKYEASMEQLSGSTWTNTNTSSHTIGNVATSSTVRMVSKPSVTSWRNINQNYIYQNSLNMHTALNSHEMKNSEWGAVSYLTQSAYGRNGNELAVNQCKTYYTGAGPGTGTSTIYNSKYDYAADTFASTYAWNTTQGKLASTTGNIYGIYDMSGGAYEYTAAYVNNGNSSLTSNGANLVNATDLKTKQVYAIGSSESQQNNYNANSSVYGDAVYETSTSYSSGNSWNGDYSNFPYSGTPFFLRGGDCHGGSGAGVFYFADYYGYTSSGSGFRPVLCVASGTAGEEATTYEVTFNANGGTIDDLGSRETTRTVTEGSTYGEATAGFPEATRSGYTFLGWFTTTEGGDQITADTVVDSTASGLTLYAQWEEIPVLMDLIPSKANAPVLGEGMKAVYWTGEDGTGETTAASYPAGTYNYTIGDGKTDSKDSKWANAITTSDGSYWVWIPRYAYKITYTTDSAKTTLSETKTQYGNIDILYMYGTSDTQYRDENGNAVDLPEGYKVHPAFQAMTTTEDLATNPLGKWDEELEGIWVAKYEASMEKLSGSTWTNTNTSSETIGNVATSSSIRMVSKPSVISWRNIRQTNIYANSKNMHTVLNSHQMKNSEWGAVAYLTQSAYGRNGNELAVNQCSSYYTGAGPGTGTSTIYNSTYEYNESTFASTYAWNTTQGKLASTTGNIYGVYDMSGGAYEYTAAYVNNGNGNLTSYGANLVNATDLKTKQVYASTVTDGSNSQSADYALAASVYGDAVYETSTNYSGSTSWHSDSLSFPYSSFPFFLRGGGYDYGSSAGVFSFSHGNGIRRQQPRLPPCPLRGLGHS